MRLSDEKISHLTHVVLKGLLNKEAIVPLSEEGLIRRKIKSLITRELKAAEDIDTLVRKKLQSYSKKIIEGTTEWDVLYQKFFREEETKKGRD